VDRAEAIQTISAREPVVVITGPTASGKTATALLLAERQGGEIVSADSMQIYRGLDIGTAKASSQERARIPHHLIDICDPGDSFSVAAYLDLALAAICDIQARGRLAIVCGGTGQYISALTEGLSYAPRDDQVRRSLETEAALHGLEALRTRLQLIDPQAWARIAPADRKRIIRALEIHELTGQPMSRHDEASRQAGPAYPFLVFCLNRARDELYRLIDARVDAMLAAGLVDEVRMLQKQQIDPSSTCLQAIGYKELLPVLRQEMSLAEAADKIRQASRRYAKRQLTWYRRLDGLHWIEQAEPAEAVAIIERIWLNYGSRQ
jgi:tRNA dimethylallyltransferase